MQDQRTSRLMPATLIAVGVLVAGAGGDVTPPGVEQILPRGRLAAVFEPTFVNAEKAAIPDDAWVMGVVIDGNARAYDLNLLNAHEVVNDRIGDTAFAAVW